MYESIVADIKPNVGHLALDIEKQHITHPQLMDADGLKVSP